MGWCPVPVAVAVVEADGYGVRDGPAGLVGEGGILIRLGFARRGGG
jgi:hypothetical protein